MPNSRTIWKLIALTGFVLLLGAVAPIFIFQDFFDATMWTATAGLLLLLVGLIGWATQLGRRARARMAGLALLPPALLVTIGFFTNPNVHGVFPLFFLACVPLSLIGIVVGIMSIASRRA